MAEQKINDEAKNCDQKSESTKTEIICRVLVFALCCLIAFNAESSLGFWGRLLSAFILSLFWYIGIFLGDVIRVRFCPGYIMSSGAGKLVYQKLFWLAGPQFIGYLCGMFGAIALLGWMDLRLF